MKRPYRPLVVLALGSLSFFARPLLHPVEALSSAVSVVQKASRHNGAPNPGANVVAASPVQTQADVAALADLRYDEWIANDDEEGAGCSSDVSSSSLSSSPQPSRYAFRMATAEIAAERSEGGAVAFLARLKMPPTANIDGGDDNAISIPVGAAELSPIEFDGAIIQQSGGKDAAQLPTRLYVSDVVTSSLHRRMGIASTLMDVLESSAFEKFGTGTMLYLHVKEDNLAAQKFYKKPRRGYGAPTSEQLQHIDVCRLEENASTAGQILLCKSLYCSHLPLNPKEENASTSTSIRGFGSAQSKGKQTAKKSKRRKR
eukprot:CAMPEP_0197723130 /NCGR_PEP_ID=MMETSP1434-20131217/5557_1 /TAXON_ID=265543 /ORGANISM="Minutocellus polymorphus, Strain CCMP3303" /LENGTH=314 /DNA_ID=CAMNT_0043308351 /DNA_START=19 /DNA_END=963 /DNA_ORIENTATION=-